VVAVTVHAAPRIVELDPYSERRWDDFVAAHPDGLVYHLPAWTQVLVDTYGYEPAALGAQDAEGRLTGVLPLVHKHGVVTGHCWSSLPHTPVAGPLAVDADTAAALVGAAVVRVRERGRAWLQLKPPSDRDAGLGRGLTRVAWRQTYVLDLPADARDLRFGNGRNHGRITQAVRRAERNGVVVRAAEDEAELQAWYPTYLDTMREHSVPPLPFRFFRTAWNLLAPAGRLRLLVAEQGPRRTPLAGSLFLMFGPTVFFSFSARQREGMSFRPNEAIHWRAINDACAEGFRSYDLGEVTEDNPGLAAFKSKWGAQRRQLHRYYYPAAREVAGGAPGPLRRVADRAWQRLPLPATAVLGDWMCGRL
jgi:CelD/BcsL family acetyltransferase involved in cellulose biosynthesis